jgi:hypothetical protein
VTRLCLHSPALLVPAVRYDEGRVRYEQVAAHVADTGATSGGLMALIGRFAAGSPAGTSPVVGELAWLHGALPSATPTGCGGSGHAAGRRRPRIRCASTRSGDGSERDAAPATAGSRYFRSRVLTSGGGG